MKIETPIPDFSNITEKLITDTRRFAEVHCVNFFKSSFQKQGFTDQSFVPWDKRKQPDYRPGGALLVSTSYLLESIDVITSDKSRIVFGSYASYAKIHNEGGILTIPITPKSRKYFWYMFKKTQDSKWKYMALSKKDFMKIKVEKRQFIGESAVMMGELEKWFIDETLKRFKNLK